MLEICQNAAGLTDIRTNRHRFRHPILDEISSAALFITLDGRYDGSSQAQRFVVTVTVRRWHRRAAAEGRWGSLTKCGVTENVTHHLSHDGPSCRFVMKIREVAQYPYSKSSSVLERRPSTDRCACNDSSYLPLRVMKRAVEENFLSMGRRNP